MSSKPQPSDRAMIAMYENLLNETTEKLKTETNKDNIETLKKAKSILQITLEKLIEVAIYEEQKFIKAYRPSSGSKTKKGGNKKRRKTRNKKQRK